MRWQILSAPRPGAVAVIALHAHDDAGLLSALRELGLPELAVGGMSLRDLWGIDQALIARWSERQCVLMPHGGAAILRAVCEALLARGIAEESEVDPQQRYPEATSLLGARMLHALACAASPRAIDLLLDQPRRWAIPGAASEPDRDLRLRALIAPALVVAIGPSNIGKSTLANALAGRGVSLVADEPGTTRDHVGVMLDLAGVVVRYVDTPGWRADAPEIERDAVRASMELLAQADVVLNCGDVTGPPLDLVSIGVRLRSGPQGEARVLRVALRSDLGEPTFPHDVRVSVREPSSLSGLVRVVRHAVVPDWAIEHPGPWRFWGDA